ncbi:MAG: HIT family protein [Ignavibacteriaceae bacterium]
MDCIFCNIVNGEEKAEILYENNHTLAFLDIRPVNFGHTLVITKKHFDNFLTVPEDQISHLIKTTQFLSGIVKRSMNADGFNIIANNGAAAGQTIYHFHFHIIPRFNNDFNFKPSFQIYQGGSMKEIADQIREVVNKYKGISDG